MRKVAAALALCVVAVGCSLTPEKVQQQNATVGQAAYDAGRTYGVVLLAEEGPGKADETILRVVIIGRAIAQGIGISVEDGQYLQEVLDHAFSGSDDSEYARTIVTALSVVDVYATDGVGGAYLSTFCRKFAEGIESRVLEGGVR